MDNYLQQSFHCYSPINENRIIFKGTKTAYEKEKYLNLKIFGIRQAISKIRASSHNSYEKVTTQGSQRKEKFASFVTREKLKKLNISSFPNVHFIVEIGMNYF